MEAIHQNVDWSDVIFAAEATKEPFQDVRVVTLKSYFYDNICEEVMREHGDASIFDPVIMHDKIRQKLLKGGVAPVRPHVAFDGDDVVVVLNVPCVDNSSFWDVMRVLSYAIEHRGDGNCVYVGEPTTYTYDEVSTMFNF